MRRSGPGGLRAVLTLLMLFGASGAARSADFLTIEPEALDGFGRIVLTFPDRLKLPEYEVTNEQNVLAIEFEQPVEIESPDISDELHNYVAVTRADPDGKGVRFGLKRRFTTSILEAGEKLFIDLLPEGWQGLPPSLPPEVVAALADRAENADILAEQRRKAEIARENNPQVDVRVGRHPTFTRMRFEWSMSTDAHFQEVGDYAEIKFEWPVGIDLTDLKGDRPPDILSLENEVTADGSTVIIELANGVTPRFFKENDSTYVLDMDFTAMPGRSVTLDELIKQTDYEVPEIEEAASPDQQAEQSDPGLAPVRSAQTSIQPFMNTIGDTVRIVFPFEQDTPAAVFKRAGTIWMLFDTHVTIDDPEPGEFDSFASGFSVDGARDLQIVRIDTGTDRLATLGAEGRSWVLSLGDILFGPTEPVELERDRAVNGALRMSVDLVRPAKVHTVRDPNVGDLLQVVTAYPPARAVVRTLDFVDFQSIKAVHGLAIRPNRPEVEVAIEGSRVVIDATDGLSLSEPGPVVVASSRDDALSRTTFIDMGAYIRSNPREFSEDREQIMQRAAAAEGQFLDAARLELARFYLSNDFAQESLGVVEVLQRETDRIEFRDRIEITHAAASVLANRPEEALGILLEDKFVDSPDAVMWRVMARAQTADWENARADALAAEGVTDNYPSWLKNRFLFAAMRAALETGDTALATRLSSQFEFADMNQEQRAGFDLLMGWIDELEGRPEEALVTYGSVISAGYRPTEAEATYRTTLVLDGLGRLDLNSAVDTLSTQAMVWRGDALEARIQQKLGELYFRNGAYREGFEIMRQAVRVHEDLQPATELLDTGKSVFADLFLNGQADALSPVEALGLFYDFRNLTPAGVQGDEMIRNLARRLVKVDLLEQAAGLLEYQVDNRLDGAGRAQIAADLAVIHIADRHPEAALKALYRTRIANLSPTVERQRKLLEAKALVDAGRNDLAIELLASMTGRDAELLKVEAHWAAGRYRMAAEIIERLYVPEQLDTPIQPSIRAHLVRAAVGYALDSDEIGLSRLRGKFADLMKPTPEWPVFEFVTGRAAPTTLKFREIAREIAATDTLGAFLKAYRDRYEPGGALSPNSFKTADLPQGNGA